MFYYWMNNKDKISADQHVIVVNQSGRRMCMSLASIEKNMVEVKAIVEWRQSLDSGNGNNNNNNNNNNGNDNKFIDAMKQVLKEGEVFGYEVDRVILVGDCCGSICNPNSKSHLVTAIEKFLQRPGVCSKDIPLREGEEKEVKKEEGVVMKREEVVQGAVIRAMVMKDENQLGNL
ncbi:hypothetical protein RFI_36574, partial [Reticulomyxa filosa]